MEYTYILYGVLAAFGVYAAILKAILRQALEILTELSIETAYKDKSYDVLMSHYRLQHGYPIKRGTMKSRVNRGNMSPLEVVSKPVK